MWDSIFFKGHFEQTVFKRYREVKGVMIPLVDRKSGYYIGAGKYDAFSREDLIPSLVRLVYRVLRKGNQKEECKKWIKTNGFLTTPVYVHPEKGESLELFLSEAKAITDLWRMYKEAVNRDFKALKSNVKISIEPLTQDEIDNEKFLWGKENDGRVCVSGLNEGECAFGVKLREVEEDPLAPYQFAVLHHIAEKACYNAGNVRIDYDCLTKHHGSDSDSFSVQAYLKPNSLIQALYLQFLQLLTENRKVCPTCWNSFIPNRKDQKFCKESHRYTYHTRNRPDRIKGGLTNGR